MNAKDARKGDVVGRVLRAAVRFEGYFDLCSAEQCAWLIERAFAFGKEAGRADARALSLGAGDAGQRRTTRSPRR